MIKNEISEYLSLKMASEGLLRLEYPRKIFGYHLADMLRYTLAWPSANDFSP